jgi:hypothetical protein
MKKYEIIAWDLPNHKRISLVYKGSERCIADFYINDDYSEKLVLVI